MRGLSKQLDPEDDVICTKYSIEQIPKIPNFNIECIKDFIKIENLLPEKNSYYIEAQKTFESCLNSGIIKANNLIQNIEDVTEI